MLFLIMPLKLCFSFVLMFNVLRVYFGQSTSTMFRYLPELDNKVCTDEASVFTHEVSNMFKCSVLCHNNKQMPCIGVFYEEIQGQCFGCSSFNESFLDTMSGTVALRGPCLHYLVKNVNNNQLTESSHYGNSYHTAIYARLDMVETITGTGGWTKHDSDTDPYIQVDFLVVKRVEGVVTQGRDKCCQYVTEYRVLLSTDCISWEYVSDYNGIPVIFPGNFDADTHVTNLFDNPGLARCVRLKPTAHYNYPSMRFDVLGCE